MIGNTAVSMTALVLCLGMFTSASVSAQPATGAARQAGVSEHQQKMRDLMKEMSREIKEMTDEMKRGGVTAERMKQLHKRMEGVSIMISRMSGLQEDMYKQMDEMKRDPSMKSPAK